MGKILEEHLPNIADHTALSSVNKALYQLISDDGHAPRSSEYAMSLRQFGPLLDPQMMTRREYLLEYQKKAMSQYQEIETIKKHWDNENWSQVNPGIKEKIESIKDKANTLTEFKEREQWLNTINEKVIRSEIDLNSDILILSDKQLTRFPAALFYDDDLKDYWQMLLFLSLYDNQFTHIPTEFGNLQALQTLYLNDNQLTHIPAELGNLQALQLLYLNDNQLTHIPAELGNLQALEWLFLGYNQLTHIPAELGKLPVLKWLNLKGNQLTSAQLALLGRNEAWFQETLNTQTYPSSTEHCPGSSVEASGENKCCK